MPHKKRPLQHETNEAFPSSKKQLRLSHYSSFSFPKVVLHKLKPDFDWSVSELEAKFIQFSSHEFVPEGLPNDLKQSDTLELLIRQQTTLYISEMKKWHEEFQKYNNFNKQVRIFLGCAGVGKSSLLLQLVLFAKMKNWIVFYIPNLSEWNMLSETDTDYFTKCNNYCASILKNLSMCELLKQVPVQLSYDFQCKTLYDVVAYGSEHVKEAPKMLNSYILELKYISNFPVLFAMDQSNSLLCQNYQNNNICQQFGNPSTFSCKSCILLLATSGTCNPLTNKFEDGDFMNWCKYIEPYTELECKFMLTYFRDKRMLPQLEQYTDDVVNKVIERTGNLPRMIEQLHTTWINNGGQNIDSLRELDALISSFKQRTVEYYKTNILEKLFVNSINDQQFINFLVDVYLSKDIKIVPLEWEISGVIVRNYFTGNYSFICPSVRDAFYDLFESKKDEIFSTICQFEGLVWKAFELLVQCHLRQYKSLTIKQFNLVGEIIAENDLTFHAKRSIFLEYPKNHQFYEMISLQQDNTLVVPHHGFNVVDLVLYSNKKLFFIQISMNSSASHKSEFNNLCAQTIPVKEGNQISQVSILDYFCTCAGMNSKSYKSNSLPEKCYFVYITAQPFLERKSKYSKLPIILVNASNGLEQLEPAFGILKKRLREFGFQ